MKTILFSIFAVITIFIACNSSPKQEKPKLETYTNEEIGWTIEIPAGFQSLSQSRIAANEQKGKEAIGKVAEGDIKMDSLRHLVNFQKNQFNSFGATIEPYAEKKAGDYLVNNQLIKKLIFDTYTNQKIKIDTLSGKEEIAGLTFQTFNIKIYGPTGEVLMNQIMFNQLIKGYDFGVNINYNNETDKENLLNAFKNSSFIKEN
ncbi:hypothetical protein EZ428_02170 [Pedobacter frigiditerrae]|uniref:Uncharacterized protein n=1 Tax=Pedobacter frigiditerrae TaxID=2530452 RepID=A0A4R0N1C8_9SPHI|nr:hypothetical protein [Pedobacter frigiditerrae]TCC93598.1 hypothetical protein EZ428_02170 [Pedobacter frigiditerrae]